MNVYKIAELFDFKGEIIDIAAYGEGHINDTFRVTIKDSDDMYILQRLNTNVFKNFRGLMDNVLKVTKAFGKIVEKEGGDVTRECMNLVFTKDAQPYYVDGDACWRAYIFIKDTVV